MGGGPSTNHIKKKRCIYIYPMVATENDGGGGAAAPPMRSAALPILYQHAPGKSGVYPMLYFELCANFPPFFC